MTKKLVLLAALITLVIAGAGYCEVEVKLQNTHIVTITQPNDIQAAHYCWWEQELYTMLVKNWHGNAASQTYSQEDTKLMDRSFIGELTKRFEKCNWCIKFQFNPGYGEVTVTITPIEKTRMMTKTLLQGAYCSYKEKAEYVINNKELYTLVWKQFGANILPPEVDFSKDMVIAVFAGEFNTGGYSVTISKVEEWSDRIEVSYSLICPGRDSPVTQALTSPYHMITCPTSIKPVTFKYAGKISH